MNFNTSLQANFNRFALCRGARTNILASGGGSPIASGGGNVVSNQGGKIMSNNVGNLTMHRDGYVRTQG